MPSEYALVRVKKKTLLRKVFITLGIMWIVLIMAWFARYAISEIISLNESFSLVRAIVLLQSDEIDKLKIDVRKIRPVNVEKGTVYIIKDGELWMETKETHPGEAIRGGG